MKQVPEYYKKRLGDLEGFLPDGKTPKLRLVFGPEAFHAHGVRKGKPKYINPDTGEPMNFWVLECWYPPAMVGSREQWPHDLMGPYPADCHQPCCNGGFWGFRSPITTYGEFIELTEDTLSLIERRQMMDVKWSLMDEVSRLNYLNEQQSAAEKIADAESWETQNVWADEYATNREKEDGADTRLIVPMGKNAISDRVKGGKEAIGHPLIII